MSSASPARTVVGRVAGAATVAAMMFAATVFAAGNPARADAVRSAQWYLGPLGITKAWSITRGAGVKVAVIDNGVDARTPELRHAVVGGRDFSGQGSPDGQAAVPSTSGPSHGTEVASVLAGRGTGPDSGVIGAAPRSSLLTASIATGVSVATDPIAKAIRWATDQGAQVINVSVIVGSDSPAVTAAVRYAESKDVVLVSGTGDEGINFVGPPASLPGVIAVSGVDRNLRSDPDADFGHGVALAGPYGTTPTRGIPVANRVGDPLGAHAVGRGVSLAAPVVAGMAALIRARFPSLDAANVINRLIVTARHSGGTRPDDHYGYGIPNVYRALTARVPTVSRNPLGSLAASGTRSSGPSGAPRSSGAPAQPSTPAPADGASAGSKSSGTWIATGAVVVVIAALVAWFITRSRRATTLIGPADRDR
jgi:subtilisin family serine protease